MSNSDESLHVGEFRQAARLASGERQLRLEYRILLEAYNASRTGDFRSAILEAGTATEVALVAGIRRACKVRGIAFGDKLISKYRALGGKFELAKLLELGLPNRDYKALILRPRNRVAHEAHFPGLVETNKVLVEVETILKAVSPNFVERRDDVSREGCRRQSSGSKRKPKTLL